MSSSSSVPELQKRQDAIDEQIASLVKQLSRSEAILNSKASSSASSASLAQYEDTIAQLNAKLQAQESEMAYLRHQNEKLTKQVASGDYRANHLIRELEAAKAAKN